MIHVRESTALLDPLQWRRNCGWHLWGRDQSAHSDSESSGNKNSQVPERSGQLPFWEDCPQQALLLGCLLSCPLTLPFLASYIRDLEPRNFSCLCLPQVLSSSLLPSLLQQGLIPPSFHNRNIGLSGPKHCPKSLWAIYRYLAMFPVQSSNAKGFILCHSYISLWLKRNRWHLHPGVLLSFKT